MGANLTIIKPDRNADLEYSWQLGKSLSGAQTAITAAQLSQCINDVTFNEAVSFVDVSRYRRARFQCWGVASNNHTATVMMYGWSESGPGSHLATLALVHGNFTSAASTGFHASSTAHKSIKNAFVATTAYQGVDTCGVTTEYEVENIFSDTDDDTAAGHRTGVVRPVNTPTITLDGVTPIHADFPTHITVDLSWSRWKYIGLLVTALQGTSLGAICKPTEFWKE